MLGARHSLRLLSASSLPGRSLLLPCRPYFRTPCLASNSRSAPRPSKQSRPTKQLQPPSIHPQPTSEPKAVSPSRISEEDVASADTRPPEEDLRSPNSGRNQALFAGFVVFDVFLWAAAKTNTETDELVDSIAQVRGTDGLDNSTLIRVKAFALAQTLKRWGASIVQQTESLPKIPRTLIRETYADAAQRYIHASDVVKVCWGICAFNGAVFLAWRVPQLTGFMYRNFIHRPLSGKSVTLLTSVFGHIGFFHILANSMALLSFGAATGYYLNTRQAEGRSNRLESTSAYHFLAFFISAGLFSSLASHMFKIRLYDRALARMSRVGQSGVRPYLGGSLGASGAIYATVTLSALAFPQVHVSPIFVPIHIPIQFGVGAMVLLDIVGFIRGWSVFDHVAHLGGAFFGVFYYHYGPSLWDSWRAFAGYLFDDKPKSV